MAKKIILIHGLGGTADGTWGNFPDLLSKDENIEYEIISCGYESPCLFKIWKRAPGILNIANGVLTDIKARCDIENDEIILAGHSLGGIILKKILLLMKNKNIHHKIAKVCFFDVPHDGSGYANAGKYVAFRNRHLKSLVRDSDELDDLNDQWINSGLNKTLRILSIISANDDIVSSSSSKSIFREHEVETINDVNHCTIVKPENTHSTVYIVFKKFILKKNTISKYKNPASRDLEDWKLVDRRNHRYNYISDEKRARDLDSLIIALKSKRAVVRLTGASGLGKTRLLLEAIESISEPTSVDDLNILVFDDPEYTIDIKNSIRKMVEDRAYGVVIIENCSVDLHNYLAKEVNKIECFLKLVTIGYANEQVDESLHIQLSPLSDEAIKKVLLPILVGMESSDVERVARFAQGYPLMATLIAEQYQKEGRLLGSIESNSVVKKLIDGDDGITPDEKEVLSACSLFDVFGTAEGSTIEEAQFIAENIAGSNLKIFERVLNKFTRRQIINRAGVYARLVPKPLALTLASEWWEEASYERQKQLIDTLPDSLMQSFCIQASYLDSQPSVQRFSDRLFSGASPFVQAEEFLTERGSKLFRAFVEVNSESTSNALYHILSACSHEQLKSINGNTRRNLVWGLEKLCFHADAFEKSAWCMLLLASAENESWSNNSTGMFAQLFRVRLSGTQAKPKIRFDLLKRAIEVNQPNIDMIVLEALSQAINTHGGARTIGAEYQGTKSPLEEWQPKIWQDIFDFWQQSIDLMLMLLGRGNSQKDKALSSIGHSIRGFVHHGRIEMLDTAIRNVVSNNGCYWPAALESIKNIITYDSKEMTSATTKIVDSWLTLLSPDNAELPLKLKILIIDPPWEHREDENGLYVDVAAENAKALATELSSHVDELIQHIGMLLVGEQKQSYVFGYQLTRELTDVTPLIDSVLENIKHIKHPNCQLILGLYRGLFEKSPVFWQKNIDRLLSDKNLVQFYPDFIRTGDIKKVHLDKLLDLINNGLLPPSSVNSLSYGGVTKHIKENVIANFCLLLAKLGDSASWVALNVIYMYCFSNKDSIGTLREQLKLLITIVPLHKIQEGSVTDVHQWHDLAKKLLIIRDQKLAVALTHQLIAATKYGLNHGDIWSHIKPLVQDLMRDYGDTLWPVFCDAIVRAEGMERYWLQQLLDRETSLVQNIPSVISVLPVESVIEWCNQFPDIGPVFVARCLNIFEITEEQPQPSSLFVALLENYGYDQRVADELRANMYSRSWTGSLVPYLQSDKIALTPLLDHENPNVRHWTRDQILYIEQVINEESKNDEERNFII